MEEKVVIFFLIIPIDNATFPESASCRWPAYLTMQQLASKKKRKEKNSTSDVCESHLA